MKKMNVHPVDAVMRRDNHAVFAIVPRFNMASLITMIEAMRVANYLLSNPAYSWEIVSFDGEEVHASNGMALNSVTSAHSAGDADFVFVLGSWGTEHYENRAFISWLRQRHRRGETICAVELGCYLVARAGLLNFKSATTHWSWLKGFEETFPNIDVVEQLYTIDDRILTCAGGFAGVDLMLRLISDDFGEGFATEVADQIMHYPIRTDTTVQRHTMAQDSDTLPSVLRDAISIMELNVEDPRPVPEIATELGISQRQLERLFKRHIGCTLVQFGLLLRLQNARLLLISTTLSVREIATASGFNTLSHFAYTFKRVFGRRPSEYRDGWPQDQPTPTWPGTLSEFISSIEQRGRS